MNDASATNEPSIEDILGSIRRIIADDEEQPATTVAPSADRYDDNDDEDDDAPLELTQKIDADGTVIDLQADETPPRPNFAGASAAPARTAAPAPVSAQEDDMIAFSDDTETHAVTDTLVSNVAADATAAVMAKLARNTAIQRPGTESVTIEDLIKDMLRPLLREWLDQNLPDMVQNMVERELEKISRRVG